MPVTSATGWRTPCGRSWRGCKRRTVMVLSPDKMELLYSPDAAAFFAGRPWALSLWEEAGAAILSLGDDIEIRYSKTQITFRTRNGFAFLSFPYRRKKGWPEECLILTFGLEHPVDHSRIAVKTEAAPNRWTHHVLLSGPGQVDGIIMEWLREAYRFSHRGPSGRRPSSAQPGKG